MSESTKTLLHDAQSFVQEQFSLVWRQEFERLFERAAEEARAQQARELLARLAQSVRALRATEGDAGWHALLLEATQGFCDRAALFTLNNGVLHLQSTRNIQCPEHLKEDQLNDVPLAAAPAFRTAVETRDTLVAMRSSREMSPLIAASFGEAEHGRFHLLPITSDGNVVALLYADGESVQVDSLELLASVAGAILESRSHPLPRKADLINIATARKEPEESPWSRLSEEDRQLHHKAQRFARVQIASIRLYESDAVKSGRVQGNLYVLLKEQIDAGRAVFRRDFIAKSNTMVDYFHLELVGTLANEEVELLGPDYPGPMV